MPPLVGYNQKKFNSLCFENSKGLLVNIWTSFFYVCGQKGSSLRFLTDMVVSRHKVCGASGVIKT
jgi:hypothetical protein